MTIATLQHRIDDCLDYVAALLRHPHDSDAWRIARRFLLISNDADRLRYLGELLAITTEDMRMHEIAWDLRELMTGAAA
jgi:hypothetical protein